MTASSLIDITLRDLAQAYHPDFLPWLKANNTHEWIEMVTLERRVNEMALESNLKGLKEALDGYQKLILTMVREFNDLKENKCQGAFNFYEDWVDTDRSGISG